MKKWLSISLSILALLFFQYYLLGQDSLAVDSTAEISQVILDESNLESDADQVHYFERFITHQAFPFVATVLFLMLLAFLAFSRLERGMKEMIKQSAKSSKAQLYDCQESLKTYGATKSTLKYLTPTLLFLYALFIGVSGGTMESYVMDWLNLMIRWAHVVAGIMWIGASFYFIFLENNLKQNKKST